MINIDNDIYFENDEDFYNFCIDPNLEHHQLDTNPPVYYFDFKFTDAYNDAVKNGQNFIIKDQNSKVVKRGAVTYHAISKPVQNLKEYKKYY